MEAVANPQYIEKLTKYIDHIKRSGLFFVLGIAVILVIMLIVQVPGKIYLISLPFIIIVSIILCGGKFIHLTNKSSHSCHPR